MSTKEYNENTQTLIGEKERVLVDKETGEIIKVKQVTKRIYGIKQFWKVYLMDFMQILGVLDSKQVDILIYILENTQQQTNTFIGTYVKIQKDVGVSSPTVAKVMKKLQETKFIKKVQNGVWQVSPKIMMKGNEHKQQMLLSYYNDEAAATSTDSTLNENAATLEAI